MEHAAPVVAADDDDDDRVEGRVDGEHVETDVGERCQPLAVDQTVVDQKDDDVQRQQAEHDDDDEQHQPPVYVHARLTVSK